MGSPSGGHRRLVVLWFPIALLSCYPGSDEGLQVWEMSSTGVPSPDDMPDRASMEGPLWIRAAPGEFEPLVLAIRSSVALRGLHLDVGAFLNTQAYPNAVAEVRLHRVVYSRPDVRVGRRLFRFRFPQWLVPAEEAGVDVEPRRTTHFWITVRVAEDAPPGVFTSIVRIRASGHPERRLGLGLVVRPFRLAPPRASFAMLYTYEFRHLERHSAGDPGNRSSRETLLRHGHAVVRDLAEHGMTTIFPHSGDEIVWRSGEVDLPDLEESLRAAWAAGMRRRPGFFLGRLLNAQYDQVDRFDALRDPPRFVEIATRAAQIAKGIGFEDVALVPSDEPNDPEGRKAPVAAQLLTAARGLRGVRLGVSAAPGLAGLVDLVIVDAGLPSTLRHEIRASGREVWLYENATALAHNPAWSRFVFGFWGWRSGLDGISAWTYPLYTFTPYYNRPRIDEVGRPTALFDEDGRPINTLVWEGIREGIDDARYVGTLQGLAAEARARGFVREAARAGLILDGLRSALSEDLGKHRKGPRGEPSPNLPVRWFDERREEIATSIAWLRLRLTSPGP